MVCGSDVVKLYPHVEMSDCWQVIGLTGNACNDQHGIAGACMKF